MQRRAPFTEFTVEDWNALVATNITSAFLVGREVAIRMQQRGRGKIINIASLQSEVSRPGIAPYAATKGAIKMLTRGMCADLAGSGICVNAIGPGYFETELTSALVADETFSAWVRARTPAGRWGKVEDLVGTLIYLASMPPRSSTARSSTLTAGCWPCCDQNLIQGIVRQSALSVTLLTEYKRKTNEGSCGPRSWRPEN